MWCFLFYMKHKIEIEREVERKVYKKKHKWKRVEADVKKSDCCKDFLKRHKLMYNFEGVVATAIMVVVQETLLVVMWIEA
jgi:hypothetical protein